MTEHTNEPSESPADELAANAETPDSASDDMKARFREALDKKNQRQHLHEQGEAGDSKAHGPHGKVGNDKTFRRKSG